MSLRVMFYIGVRNVLRAYLSYTSDLDSIRYERICYYVRRT